MDQDSLSLLAGWAGVDPLFIIFAVLWTLVWKGFALWRAAELKQKYWFIAILLINTLGILEMIYIFFVAKGYRVEVIEKSG